ncbi:type II toxin-antitoxin system HicB family antitoxin [Eubacteriales bacterium OttesenSCG-928-K08]|nr:type II toxin-antitoxin system HicB family antitoxin [Eubacteriales bacterium OttesenSCG-928-K08]
MRTFTLRLTPEQHEMLERGAEKEKISKNQFIVRLLENSNAEGLGSGLRDMRQEMMKTQEQIQTLQYELEDAVAALRILGATPVDDEDPDGTSTEEKR